MRRVIFNQKGGVGKSSIAVNLAALSARRGRSTLLLDLDAQGNATQYLLGDAQPETTVAGFFEQFLSFHLTESRLGEFVLHTPYDNLDLVAASPALTDLQSRLEAKHKINKLRDGLGALGAYDAVFIDTPPAFNFYTLSALIAADTCVIPFDCDSFAREALYHLLNNVAEVKADHNPALRVEGIIVNQFQKQAKLPRRIVDELKAEDLPLFETLLPASVKMRESHEAETPLVHFAPKHPLSKAFVALYDELVTA
ncbi:MAG: ParA family protein [Bacteroidota bacterium]